MYNRKSMSKFLFRVLAFTAMAALSVGLLLAGDPGGDWKASVAVDGVDYPLTFHLKAKDATLTGSIEGMPTTPADIKEGKIDGDNITFIAMTEYQGNPVKLVYKGALDGDQIKFFVATDDGSWEAQFVAKRSANN